MLMLFAGAGVVLAATAYTPVGTTYYTSVSLPAKGDALTADSVSTAIKRALDNTAYVKAQGEAGTYGGATSEPRVIRSALTLGSSYEIRSSQLALNRWKTFGKVARAYTISAGSEYGWTKDANFTSTNLSAANEDTTTNDALRLAHKAVSTAYNSSVRTAPTMYRSVVTTSDGWTVITARVQINSQTANGQQGGILMVQDDDNTKLTAVWCGYISGGHKCESYTNGGGLATTTLSSATLTAGVWVQVASMGLATITRYSATSQTTPPNDWTLIQANSTAWSANDKILRMGIVIMGSASGAFTLDVPYYDTQVWQEPKIWNYKDLSDDWAAQGFDSTSPAIQLIADWDIGQGTPSQAKLRQILADAVNQLDPTTTSTWTFSAVCSSSAGATAGSYAAAASVTLTDTGDYCNLWAKATSDGYYPATLDVDSITMPVIP